MAARGPLRHSYPAEHGVPTTMPHSGQASSGWWAPSWATAFWTPSSPGHAPPPPDTTRQMAAPAEPRRSGRAWLEARAFRHQPGGDVAPQGNQQLPGQGHGGNLADAAADLADPH